MGFFSIFNTLVYLHPISDIHLKKSQHLRNFLFSKKYYVLFFSSNCPTIIIKSYFITKIYYRDGITMTNINDSEPISPQYSLRLPVELREKLTNAAKSNSHSLNKEIIIRLEQSLILEKCPECVKYLQTVKNHEKIFEEQYKMFKELNKKDTE